MDCKVGFYCDPVEVLGPKTGHLLEHRGLLRRNHLVTAGGADLPDTEPWDAQLRGSCSFTRSAVSILCTKPVGEQARSHDVSGWSPYVCIAVDLQVLPPVSPVVMELVKAQGPRVVQMFSMETSVRPVTLCDILEYPAQPSATHSDSQ